MSATLKRVIKSMDRNDPQAALAALESGSPAEGEEIDFAYFRGICLIAAGRHAEAIAYLEQVVSGSGPRARQCRILLAYAGLSIGDPSMAEYELNRFLDDFGPDSQAYAMLGFSALARGLRGEALAFYEKAIQADPEYAPALNAAGYILAGSGEDPAKALAYCRRAVESDPRNPAYLDSLGWTLCSIGYKDKGRVLIERALKSAPGAKEIESHFRSLKEGDE
jgi:tetratricopeptide (TPR) repeat protein